MDSSSPCGPAKKDVNKDLSQSLKDLKQRIAENPDEDVEIEPKSHIMKEAIKYRNEIKSLGIDHPVPSPSSLKKMGVDKLRLYRREFRKVLESEKDTEAVTRQAEKTVKRSYARKRLKQGAPSDAVAEEISEGKHTDLTGATGRDLATLNLILCQSLEVACECIRESLPEDSRMKHKLPLLDGWTDELKERKEELDSIWSEIHEEHKELEILTNPFARLGAVLAGSGAQVHIRNKVKKASASRPQPTPALPSSED